MILQGGYNVGHPTLFSASEVMISSRQAAQRLGVTQRQVLRFVELGLLTARQIDDYPNAPWLISEESLEQLIATRTAQPPRRGRKPTATAAKRRSA